MHCGAEVTESSTNKQHHLSTCTISAHGARARNWTVPIGAKHQEPKHPFGLPQDSPAQPTCAAVRHAPGVERARKKQSGCESNACSHRAQALPVGQELDIGQFPSLRHSMWQSVIKCPPCIDRVPKKQNKCKSIDFLSVHVEANSTGKATWAQPARTFLRLTLWDLTRARWL